MTVLLKKYADHVGIAASGLCLVHCLLMPLLLGVWFEKDLTATHAPHEEGFNYDYLFLGFSALAIWLASAHCHKTWIKGMMWGCFSLLTTGVLLEPYLSGAHLATFPAAIGLAAAHFFNWRSCRHCHPKRPHREAINSTNQI